MKSRNKIDSFSVNIWERANIDHKKLVIEFEFNSKVSFEPGELIRFHVLGDNAPKGNGPHYCYIPIKIYDELAELPVTKIYQKNQIISVLGDFDKCPIITDVTEKE